jgi:hypothetical protein
LPVEPNQSPSSSGVIDVAVTAPTAGSLAEQGAPGATGSAPAPASRPRRWLIHVAIVATALLCVATVAMLYLQWWRTETRNSLIIVWGEPSWEGAVAEVTGPALPPQGFKHTLTKEGDLLARFHVPAGIYLVRVYKIDDRGKVTTELARKSRDPMRPLQPGGIWWPFRAPPGVAEMGLDK